MRFLIDSGLLFEINRATLHIFGIALAASTNTDGQLKLLLKDSRSDPAALTFTCEEFTAGKAKLQAFLTSFGHAQLEKRRKKLGFGTQEYPNRKT